MAAPVWITPPGDLGTIVESEFYNIRLEASGATSYEYHSGVLPNGIEIKRNGNVEGYPRAQNFIQGVPAPVAEDTTSRFVVRARSDDNQVADRVFELTVTGPDAPIIQNLPDADLGAYFDGDYVNIQLYADDADPGDTLTWMYQSGELPIGLTVSSTGLISGYINPVPTLTGVPGFDVQNYDINSFDFRAISENKFYEFVIQVTDGLFVATKKYNMFVASRNSVSSDTDQFTADSFAPTAIGSNLNRKMSADQTQLRTPALLTKSTDFGVLKHDNRYNLKFDAIDFDGDRIEYEISIGPEVGYDNDAGFDSEIRGFDQGEAKLPPGLVLDVNSGWMTGTIPIQASTKIDYEFSVRAKKADFPLYRTPWVPFTLTVEGDIDSEVQWPASDLGSIKTGDVCELDIRAHVSSGRQVLYELKTGYPQSIPQGIVLNTDGLLVGRTSFETFTIDTGTTTFDVEDHRTAETTFEKNFSFTVRVYSPDGVIDTYQTFKLRLINSNFTPYENLYAKALPNSTQRSMFTTLMRNTDDIPPEDLYRPTDWNFGIQNDLRFIVAAGLRSRKEHEYIAAISKNHYNNTMRFGDLATARAMNTDGTVKYEVVYANLVDKGMGINSATKNPAPGKQSIDLRLNRGYTNPITIDSPSVTVDNTNMQTSQRNDYLVFSNAIENMRIQLKDTLDQTVLERYVLPQWMRDKQEDNSIIGWKLAVPLVYCMPGTSKRIKYLLEQRDIKLQDISFEVDRFILDNNLSKYFDKDTGKFISTRETTFDAIDLGPGRNSLKNIKPVASVDYLLDRISYDQINHAPAAQVISRGLIDGLNDPAQIPAAGIDVIWRVHTGLNVFNHGWNNYDRATLFGGDFDRNGFEESAYLPGYYEKYITETSLVNYQAGVWNITIDADGLFVLTFKQEINRGEVVAVDWQASSFYYENRPTGGALVPVYRRIDANAEDVNLTTFPTEFDAGGTKFFSQIDVYHTSDEGDKYIKFPKVGVFK